MSKLHTLIKLVASKDGKLMQAVFLNLYRSPFMKMIGDKTYLKFAYKTFIGKPLNLQPPKTFNEKLQWLKLYDRNPEYHKMVDKYLAKKYVASVIGDEYIIPSYGVWDSVNDIEWDNLPNKFVLKTTGGAGGQDVVICKDKQFFDVNKAVAKIKKSLEKPNCFWFGREWCYYGLKNKIIAEMLLEDPERPTPFDYKFMCFNGKVQCSFVCTNRYQEGGLKVTFYDREWQIMPFERSHPKEQTPLPKPDNYEKMIELAEKLSSGLPFVRVDFYNIQCHIYFGELTFYPGSGFERFQPEEWDEKLGDMILIC